MLIVSYQITCLHLSLSQQAYFARSKRKRYASYFLIPILLHHVLLVYSAKYIQFKINITESQEVIITNCRFISNLLVFEQCYTFLRTVYSKGSFFKSIQFISINEKKNTIITFYTLCLGIQRRLSVARFSLVLSHDALIQQLPAPRLQIAESLFRRR